MKKSAPCFVTVEVKQEIDTIKFDVNRCCSDESFFEFINVGDSIRKESTSFSLIIIKRGVNKKREFGYPYCFQ